MPKKTVKKPVKKPVARKTVRKPVKKTTKPATKKQVKKPVKKTVRRVRKPAVVQVVPVQPIFVQPVVDPSGVVIMTPVRDDLLNK